MNFFTQINTRKIKYFSSLITSIPLSALLSQAPIRLARHPHIFSYATSCVVVGEVTFSVVDEGRPEVVRAVRMIKQLGKLFSLCSTPGEASSDFFKMLTKVLHTNN